MAPPRGREWPFSEPRGLNSEPGKSSPPPPSLSHLNDLPRTSLSLPFFVPSFGVKVHWLPALGFLLSEEVVCKRSAGGLLSIPHGYTIFPHSLRGYWQCCSCGKTKQKSCSPNNIHLSYLIAIDILAFLHLVIFPSFIEVQKCSVALLVGNW